MQVIGKRANQLVYPASEPTVQGPERPLQLIEQFPVSDAGTRSIALPEDFSQGSQFSFAVVVIDLVRNTLHRPAAGSSVQ